MTRKTKRTIVKADKHSGFISGFKRLCNASFVLFPVLKERAAHFNRRRIDKATLSKDVSKLRTSSSASLAAFFDKVNNSKSVSPSNWRISLVINLKVTEHLFERRLE